MAFKRLQQRCSVSILLVALISIGTDAIITQTNPACRTGNSTTLYPFLKSRKVDKAIGLPCVFPFTLRGKIYHACTYDFSFATDYKPWCSTKVDENGNHIIKNPDGSKNWGICLEEELECPIPPRRCGAPKSTRKAFVDGQVLPTANIQQQPWMVSLGKWGLNSFTTWVHQCAGSVITNKHILTAAHCFSGVMDLEFKNRIKGEFARYKMRMGTADLESIHSAGGIERRVVDIRFHPRYEPGRVYYNVGIAIAGEAITFNDFIRPVCLPYLPVDYNDYLADNFVTLAGWGYTLQARAGAAPVTELTSNLKLRSLKVETQDNCNDYFSEASFNEASVNISIREQRIPIGFSSDLACVDHDDNDFAEGGCGEDSGSPVVQRVSGTARDEPYYEQQFIVSTGLDCRLRSTIYTRISERKILTWIQEITDTTPLVMVVAGYSKFKELKDPNTQRCKKDENGKCKFKPGLINDVELLSLSSGTTNRCTKFVKPVFGNSYLLGEDEDGLIVENEGEAVGMVGVFSKDAPIVCGGKNGDGDLNRCYEWDSNTNQWKSQHMFPEGITPMEQQRVYASSVLDQEGNMWVTGGNYENNASDSTEVYEYKPKGAGKWRKGYPLPKSYRNTGIESHCTVRINATHIFMGGGFLTEYKIQDELEYGGGEYPEGDGQYEYADYGDGEYADYGKGEGGEYYEGDYPKEGADTKLPEEQDQRERKRRRRADDDAHYTDSNYDYSDETGGALQTEKVWLFDGNTWNEMSPMSIARDRPACSIINMPDGKINILVAGGCDGWCAEKPPIKNVEMYNVETNAWQKLADLPIPLSSAKLELLGNRPTIIGGYDLDADTQNGKLYQYFVETDEWKAHDVEMRLPRSSAAVFQVPRNFFRC